MRQITSSGHSFSHDLVSLENAFLVGEGDLRANRLDNRLQNKNLTLCAMLWVRYFLFRPQGKWDYKTEHSPTQSKESEYR